MLYDREIFRKRYKFIFIFNTFHVDLIFYLMGNRPTLPLRWTIRDKDGCDVLVYVAHGKLSSAPARMAEPTIRAREAS